jgi:hypothetical protein
MFYYLFLAHLLADYPLQPNWLVSKKTRWGFLAIHALIQFLTSIIIVWIFYSTTGLSTWPYLLLLAGIHLTIDTIKNLLSRKRSNWVKIPYLLDQFLHFISIMVISLLIQDQFGFVAFPLNPGWVVLAIAYLLVTYVWYVSERVMTYDNPGYRQSVIDDSWSRMLFRAVFLTGILGFWKWGGKMLIAPAVSLYFPYQTRQFGRRALLTDLTVTLGVYIFIVVIPYSSSLLRTP